MSQAACKRLKFVLFDSLKWNRQKQDICVCDLCFLTSPPRRKKLYSSMLSLPATSRILAHIWKLKSSLCTSNRPRHVYLQKIYKRFIFFWLITSETQNSISLKLISLDINFFIEDKIAHYCSIKGIWWWGIVYITFSVKHLKCSIIPQQFFFTLFEGLPGFTQQLIQLFFYI